MEMIHHPLSNFYCGSQPYANYKPNDKPVAFHHTNNYDNRICRSKILDIRCPQPIHNNINNQNINQIKKNEQSDLDKNIETIEFKNGMGDVPIWLKSLRLHKYKLLFSEMTYEEMLALTEKQLEEKNVTKGARHKIIVNIEKLRARQSNVINMEKSIDQEGISGIRQSLNELKNMLLTPIKAFEPDTKNKYSNSADTIEEGNLASQIMKLLEKIFTCIQNESMRDDEIVNLYLNNCEKCLSHEAFTAFHKQRLIKIKSKLDQFRICGRPKNIEINKTTKNNFKWTNQGMSLVNLQNTNLYTKNNSSNLSTNYQTINNFCNAYTNNHFINNHSAISQHFHHHPYQNNSKLPCSNSVSSFQSSNNFYLNKGQMKISNNNNNLINLNNIKNSMNKINDDNIIKINQNINLNKNRSYNSLDTLNSFEANTNSILTEKGNNLSENKFLFSNNLARFSDVFNELNKYDNYGSETNSKLEDSNKIISPLDSCSLFSACSQIGKLTKNNSENINQKNFLNHSKIDSFNNQDYDLISKLKTNQNNSLFSENSPSDTSILKYIENTSSIEQNGFYKTEFYASERDDCDDKYDENHQIYNHIELLSLRMTEQALGSSEFS